ncbi:hypothetical protein [Congregicoccus parvus]|uniref:hypothetical protein n=1 Tax=Congregicoccus parvus TaxID=3081749 RepID=UPI003FA534B2
MSGVPVTSSRFFFVPFASIALAIAFAGCATSTTRTIPPARMHVEAIRNDAAPLDRYAYVLVDGMPPGSDEATFFAEAAAHVRTALSAKGLFEAPEGTRPDMVIEIDFGMEAPMIAVGDSYNIGWTGDNRTALRVGEIIYDKYFRITARETQAEAGNRPPRELWSIYVVNTDYESNLPRYILLMVSAAMDMIGDHSATRRTVVLTIKDERVIFVGRGME